MRNRILTTILAATFSIVAIAQQEVTLTTIGQGNTKNEAVQNALRQAIEQAFGTFVSSKTEILNDNLIKDEIVSVSNGNIKKYDIVNEQVLPEGSYVTTIKSTVSIDKLTSFVESKGGSVELKGNLFAANIKMQQLHKKNEAETIKNLNLILNDVFKNSFDYKIEAKDPFISSSKDDKYIIPLTIEISTNENFNTAVRLLIETIQNLALTESEVSSFKDIKKDVKLVSINNTVYHLRGEETIFELMRIMLSVSEHIRSFMITTNSSEPIKWSFNKAFYNYTKRKYDFFSQHSGTINESELSPFVENNPRSYQFPRIGFLELEAKVNAMLSGRSIFENKSIKGVLATQATSNKPFYSIEMSIPPVGAGDKIKIHYDDVKSLEELNTIQGYFIEPIFN